jgi:hypothetical protein
VGIEANLKWIKTLAERFVKHKTSGQDVNQLNINMSTEWLVLPIITGRKKPMRGDRMKRLPNNDKGHLTASVCL